MNEKELIRVAKLEIQEWVGLPRHEVMMILWAFIHRITMGRTVEQTFFPKSNKQRQPDYEI